MKITKQKLKQIIKEELERALNEGLPAGAGWDRKVTGPQGTARWAALPPDAQYYGGGSHANDQLTKFENRLGRLGIDEARQVVNFLNLVSTKVWVGQREQKINDLTAMLAGQKVEGSGFPRDFVLLRVDNKKARSVMKSIRQWLKLSDEDQRKILDELMIFTGLKEREQ
jgi:hypothetical protein